MKISEVTQPKVTRTAGNKVTVDHGDGTETTIDTRKNPNAISRDDQGKLKVSKTPANSRMGNSSNKSSAPRPGERIEIDDED